MKTYIIFIYYGTYIVAAKSPGNDAYGVVAECRTIEQARVVKAALEAEEGADEKRGYTLEGGSESG